LMTRIPLFPINIISKKWV